MRVLEILTMPMAMLFMDHSLTRLGRSMKCIFGKPPHHTPTMVRGIFGMKTLCLGWTWDKWVLR